MLGGTLVTKQSGPEGKPVSTLLVAQKMSLSREKYFALALDRKAAGPVAIACSEGGTSIEELVRCCSLRGGRDFGVFTLRAALALRQAHDYPDRIVRVAIDPLVGLTDAQADTIVDGLRCTSDRADAVAQVKALYKARTQRSAHHLGALPLFRAPSCGTHPRLSFIRTPA